MQVAYVAPLPGVSPGKIYFLQSKGVSEVERRGVVELWLLWLYKKRDRAGQAAAKSWGHLHKVHLSLYLPLLPIILQTTGEMGLPVLLRTPAALTPRE